MNITPINNFSTGRNNNTELTNKNQSFGMTIEPAMDTFNGILRNRKVKPSTQYLIQYFLTDTLETHFNSNTLLNIFQEALRDMGAKYKGYKVTDIIPDFKERIVPLKFHIDEEGLKGELGRINSEPMVHGDIIANPGWTDDASKNKEIFHDPIKKLTKSYARMLLNHYNPLNNYY